MTEREHQLIQLTLALKQFPIVTLLGPRQVGKTTLARQLAALWDGPTHHFDLEDPDDQARLREPCVCAAVTHRAGGAG